VLQPPPCCCGWRSLTANGCQQKSVARPGGAATRDAPARPLTKIHTTNADAKAEQAIPKLHEGSAAPLLGAPTQALCVKCREDCPPLLLVRRDGVDMRCKRSCQWLARTGLGLKYLRPACHASHVCGTKTTSSCVLQCGPPGGKCVYDDPSGMISTGLSQGKGRGKRGRKKSEKGYTQMSERVYAVAC
jgi:hypothetical protein